VTLINEVRGGGGVKDVNKPAAGVRTSIRHALVLTTSALYLLRVRLEAQLGDPALPHPAAIAAALTGEDGSSGGAGGSGQPGLSLKGAASRALNRCGGGGGGHVGKPCVAAGDTSAHVYWISLARLCV
jgi:hypothetical protein